MRVKKTWNQNNKRKAEITKTLASSDSDHEEATADSQREGSLTKQGLISAHNVCLLVLPLSFADLFFWIGVSSSLVREKRVLC